MFGTEQKNDLALLVPEVRFIGVPQGPLVKPTSMSLVDPCGGSENGCPHGNVPPAREPWAGDEPVRPSKLCDLFIKHNSTPPVESSPALFFQEHSEVRALGAWVELGVRAPANP